jgi:hypothetical protein
MGKLSVRKWLIMRNAHLEAALENVSVLFSRTELLIRSIVTTTDPVPHDVRQQALALLELLSGRHFYKGKTFPAPFRNMVVKEYLQAAVGNKADVLRRYGVTRPQFNQWLKAHRDGREKKHLDSLVKQDVEKVPVWARRKAEKEFSIGNPMAAPLLPRPQEQGAAVFPPAPLALPTHEIEGAMHDDPDFDIISDDE